MNCPACGQAYLSSDRECPNCGIPLSTGSGSAAKVRIVDSGEPSPEARPATAAGGYYLRASSLPILGSALLSAGLAALGFWLGPHVTAPPANPFALEINVFMVVFAVLGAIVGFLWADHELMEAFGKIGMAAVGIVGGWVAWYLTLWVLYLGMQAVIWVLAASACHSVLAYLVYWVLNARHSAPASLGWKWVGGPLGIYYQLIGR